jgi:putative acetyltransferase
LAFKVNIVKRGIEMLGQSGCPFIIVLGQPEYYPRFGFVSASSRRVTCQWERVPDEAFMILILDDKRIKGVSGKATDRDEFISAI